MINVLRFYFINSQYFKLKKKVKPGQGDQTRFPSDHVKVIYFEKNKLNKCTLGIFRRENMHFVKKKKNPCIKTWGSQHDTFILSLKQTYVAYLYGFS